MFDRYSRLGAAAAGLAACLILAPGSVQAQDGDTRWLPWSGCWETAGEQEGQDVVCVRLNPDGSGVTLTHSLEGFPDQVIRTDGREHAVSQAGCEGVESAEFSPDRSRIYIRGEYDCDGVRQTSTGLIAMVAPDEWVDIRSLEMEGERIAWVQSYVEGTPAAVRAAGEEDLVTPQVVLARRMAARAPEVDDLVEVSRNVDAQVASTWVAAVGQPFDLDGKTLVALAESGVDTEVIDIAVAVSNPRHFSVGVEGAMAVRDGGARRSYQGDPYYGYGAGWPYGSRRYMTPWGSYLGYNSFYGYNGIYGGYGGGYYPYGGFAGPTVIVVDRNTSSSDPGGRAIGGQGYTRRGSSPPSGSSYTPPRSRGGSSAGASSGTRGGSGSSGTTRKAKPRGGGGGGI